LTGGDTLSYRLAALDLSGNVSAPSQVVSLRVVDTSIPATPTWVEAKWVLVREIDNGEEPWPPDSVIPSGRRAAVRLVWNSTVAKPRFVLNRTLADQWSPRPVSIDPHSIAPAKYLSYDTEALPSEQYRYQIGVISSTGVPSGKLAVIEVNHP
jgi:hypothetical protein